MIDNIGAEQLKNKYKDIWGSNYAAYDLASELYGDPCVFNESLDSERYAKIYQLVEQAKHELSEFALTGHNVVLDREFRPNRIQKIAMKIFKIG